MKPKQPLEELIERQDEEMQLEAEYIGLALKHEDELENKIYNDMSQRVDVPRDVQGLVKLLEERKELEAKKPEIIDTDYLGWSVVLGYSAGAASAIYTTMKEQIADLFSVLILILTPALGGVLAGEVISRRRSKNNKKIIEQLKEENRALIKSIDQELSHYQKRYAAGDILLVDDPELGYSLGHVVNNEGELRLRQTCPVQRPNSDALDNRAWYLETREKPIDEDHSYVLKPARELSADDLQSYEDGTPLLCIPAEQWQIYPCQRPRYGFLKKSEKVAFAVHTLRNFKGLEIGYYSFEGIKREEVKVHLLAPEIKSSRPASVYRIGA